MRQHPIRRRAFAALLAALAGYVDAIGFLTLGGFFVSFMSGNSTRAGVDGAFGVADAFLALAIIGLFVTGVIVASLIGERAGPRRSRHVLWAMTAALAASTVLVAAGYPLPGMLAAAVAMGATNAIFAPGSGLPVGLTYMTGTLVRLGQAIAQVIAGSDDRRAWLPYALHWLALIGGALLGALAYRAVGAIAIGVAVVVCAAAAIRANAETD